jgi:DNA-binding NarL/FixJ family response regulator
MCRRVNMSQTSPIKLVVADDHPIVLQGLRHLFERQSDFVVAACCVDGSAAIGAVRVHQADVVVLDLQMPGASGLDALRLLADQRLACRAVVLTAAITQNEVVEAVKLGARGLVLKESSPDTLVSCIRRVHQGEQWIDHDTVTRAFRTVLKRDSATREVSETLTAREIEIVRMIGQGMRNRVIAGQLSISEGTVKVHLHNIYEKVGVDGRLELVLFAQQKGLI